MASVVDLTSKTMGKLKIPVEARAGLTKAIAELKRATEEQRLVEEAELAELETSGTDQTK